MTGVLTRSDGRVLVSGFADRRGPGEAGGLVLADLLQERWFGLRLLAGGDDALGRPVRGAHSVDAHVGVAGFERDWIVLTTGASVQHDPDGPRRLVAETHAAGATGLGLCLGDVCDDVQAELLDEADRRSLPLFTVPPTTPAREVIAFVQRSLVSEEALAFSRMAALQGFLLDAVGQPDARRTLLFRLAELVQARAGIIGPSGRFLLATTPEPPAADVVRAIAGRRLLTVPVDAGGFHGHAFALGDPERPDVAWLVVGVPAGRRLHPLAKAAGSAAVPLLAALDRLDRAERKRDDAARQAAFEALLDAETAQAARVAAAQMSSWGARIADGVTAVVLTDASGRLSATELLDLAVRAGSSLDGPLTATVRDGRVAALLPAALPGEDLVGLVAVTCPDVRAGLGRTVVEPLDVQRSLSEAALALDACPGHRAIGRYDDLDLSTLLLHELRLDRLTPKMDAWLEPLQAAPRVYQTLVAYLEQDLDVGRTAQALRVHPNSVRYRLARAEALMGAPVKSPSTMVALIVAVAARRAKLASGQKPDSAWR